MAELSVDIKELKKLLNHCTLLYVEDNAGLRAKAATLFQKIFPTVYEAQDGQVALELFHKHTPDFVITDIQMPHLNGIELSKEIKKIKPKTKLLITTAFDDKEYLLQSIELKVDGYLIKPMQINKITELLYKIAKEVHEEQQKQIYNNYLYSIFNHQDNLIIMLKDDNVVLVNDHVLEFFDAKSTAEFKDKFKNFTSILEPHDTFLYPYSTQDDCLAQVKKDIDKLYNIKVLAKDGSPHHFILKLTHISDKENFYILSLTDITELNLLALYDKNSLEHDNAMKDEKTIYSLLKAAKESGAIIKLYNFYKGLTVCNNGVIAETTKGGSVIKTSALQLKAAQHEKKMILNCEIFPYDLQTDRIIDISFSTQAIEIGKCKMLKTTPSQRKYLILEPDPTHTVTLFYNKRKFDTEATVINISKESAKIRLKYLPAGLKEKDSLILDMVFSDDVKPYIINTNSIILKIIPIEKEFYLICVFDLKPSIQKILISYLASRQMKLVKEFKGLQI